MMTEMKPGDLSPSEEVVVLMSKEEPRPSDPQVATFVPKHDVKKTKETSKLDGKRNKISRKEKFI